MSSKKELDSYSQLIDEYKTESSLNDLGNISDENVEQCKSNNSKNISIGKKSNLRYQNRLFKNNIDEQQNNINLEEWLNKYTFNNCDGLLKSLSINEINNINCLKCLKKHEITLILKNKDIPFGIKGKFRKEIILLQNKFNNYINNIKNEKNNYNGCLNDKKTILENNKLYIYDKNEVINVFNINDFCVALNNVNKNNQFYVVFVDQKECYKFVADNECERNEWVKQINKKKSYDLIKKGRYLIPKENIVCDGCQKTYEYLYECSIKNCKQTERLLCDECSIYFHLLAKSDHTFSKKIGYSLNKYQLTNFEVKTIKLSQVPTVTSLTIESLHNTIIQSTASTAVNIGPSVAAFGVGTCVVFLSHLCCNYYKLKKNDITLYEFKRLTCRSAITSISTSSIIFGCSIAGTAIGTTAFPVIGTVVGGLVGVGIGFILAVLAHVGIIKLFDKLWKKDDIDEWINIKIIEALKYFGFNENDMHDKNIFNKRELDKKYKKLSKDCHPDRNNGNNEKFLELKKKYELLIAVLKNRIEEKNNMQTYQIKNGKRYKTINVCK